MANQNSNFSRLKFAVWFFGSIAGFAAITQIAQQIFDANTYAPISLLLILALSIVWLYPIVRRLQDMGRSGWWAILLYTPINFLLILALLLVPGDKKKNART